MNINRHNYEEIFLLYVDNELTAAQRKIVEAFVAVNPDLQEEFRLMNDTKFDSQAMLDDAFKTSLLKPNEEEELFHEERLLLYIDNELPETEKKSIDEAAAKNEELYKRLQLLQRTVVKADTSIAFPDKSLLYKDAQPARVFAMVGTARRWAAAAAIVLLLGAGIWLMIRNQPPGQETTVHSPAVQPKADKPNKPTINPGVTIITESQQSLPGNYEEVQPTISQLKKQKPVVVPAGKNNRSTLVKIAPAVHKEQKPHIDSQQKQEETVAVSTDPLTTSKNETITTTTSNKITPTPVSTIETNTVKNTVAYLNNNDESSDDDEEGFINEIRQRSSGLKSFFKKAKRTLERRTGIQSGDSQVRFAVFAVNTQ